MNGRICYSPIPSSLKQMKQIATHNNSKLLLDSSKTTLFVNYVVALRHYEKIKDESRFKALDNNFEEVLTLFSKNVK